MFNKPNHFKRRIKYSFLSKVLTVFLPDNNFFIKQFLSSSKRYLLNQQQQCSNDLPKPALIDLAIDIGKFSISECQKAIKSLGDNKAPGFDSAITSEALKNGGFSINNHMVNICNSVFKGAKPRWQWTPNKIVPVPKKGDLTLMSTGAKIFNKMLLNLIRPVIDPMLCNNQVGFRPGRSTIEMISCLRSLVEGAKYKNFPLITLVDFPKAFDSIDRKMIFAILRSYGIPQLLV